MTPAAADRHIRRAWILAVLWAGWTIVAAVPFVVAGDRLAGMSPALILASALALLAIALGARRRSRLCAVLLLVVGSLDAAAKVTILGWSHVWFSLIPLFFFAVGAWATFAWHRGSIVLSRPFVEEVQT